MPEITRMDEATMDEAVDYITDLPGVEEGTNNTVWCTFRATDDTQLQGAIDAALTCKGVLVHKVDREDAFLSIVLEEYAEEI